MSEADTSMRHCTTLTEDDLWRHSTAASLAVRAIGRECPKAGLTESAAIAGLVHDVGKLIMVRYMKADFSAILELRDRRQHPLRR